jgi:hypothetical protein
MNAKISDCYNIIADLNNKKKIWAYLVLIIRKSFLDHVILTKYKVWWERILHTLLATISIAFYTTHIIWVNNWVASITSWIWRLCILKIEMYFKSKECIRELLEGWAGIRLVKSVRIDTWDDEQSKRKEMQNEIRIMNKC